VPIVGVAWFGNDASMQAFVDRHGLTFPNVNDNEGLIFDRFGVPGQPAWVVVAADGKVARRLGAMDDAMLDATLDSALAAAGGSGSS
jgi:peroxiredoxin